MNTNRLVRGRIEEGKKEKGGKKERKKENFAFGKIVNPENISKQITLPFPGNVFTTKIWE